jgi:predicted Zn-dependent protease
MAGRIDSLLSMLDRGQDSALLRFSLGNEFLAAGDAANALRHLQAAVRLDAGYSAAWKLLGKAHSLAGDTVGAIEAYEAGIRAASDNGDRQAAREMQVFLRRLQKQQQDSND